LQKEFVLCFGPVGNSDIGCKIMNSALLALARTAIGNPVGDGEPVPVSEQESSEAENA
jgi:hypothetical protein